MAANIFIDTSPVKKSEHRIYAIASDVKAETEKAFLIEASWDIWLPKSQISVYRVNRDEGVSPLYVISLPVWLWKKNQTALTITTDENNLRDYGNYMTPIWA